MFVKSNTIKEKSNRNKYAIMSIIIIMQLNFVSKIFDPMQLLVFFSPTAFCQLQGRGSPPIFIGKHAHDYPSVSLLCLTGFPHQLRCSIKHNAEIYLRRDDAATTRIADCHIAFKVAQKFLTLVHQSANQGLKKQAWQS